MGGHKYKLIYFDGRGRAETIRLIFAVSGVKYEDHRVTFQEWSELKQKMPTGTMPVLEVDGETMLPDSLAICRYLAREADIAGKTNLDKAMVDAVAANITDVREAAIKVVLCKDEGKKADLMEEFKKTAKIALGNVEKKHKCNQDGKGFLHGDTLTWADLHFYACIELTHLFDSDVLKPYPTLEALWNRVADAPKIAAYVKTRKETPF